MVGEARGWWGGKEEAGERGEEEERGGRGEQRKVAAGKGQTTWQSSTSSAQHLLDLLRTHLIGVASCVAPLLTGSEGRTDRTISVLSFSNVPYHSSLRNTKQGRLILCPRGGRILRWPPKLPPWFTHPVF